MAILNTCKEAEYIYDDSIFDRIAVAWNGECVGLYMGHSTIRLKSIFL